MWAGAHLSAPVWASKRAVAMASTSSMKMMAGAFSLARRNTSRTMRGPCITAMAAYGDAELCDVIHGGMRVRNRHGRTQSQLTRSQGAA